MILHKIFQSQHKPMKKCSMQEKQKLITLKGSMAL